MLTILIEPNSILRTRCQEMTREEIINPATQKIIEEMIIAMRQANGIGLAAAQVGIAKRIIVVDQADGPQAYINPHVTDHSKQMVESEEGCLSVPGVWGIVKRFKKIRLKARDRQGRLQQLKATGLLAFVFQHEIDHLDGILFIDKAERLEKGDKATSEL